MLSLLTFSTLYPNAIRPNHGVFVENRLRHLVATGEVQATVLAPVPWFPGRSPDAGVPPSEQRHGLLAYHPRFLAVPGIGMRVSPWLLHAGAQRVLARLLAAGARFDAIDAHYFYPDGVAAIRLGRQFNLPVVITARGSDVTQFPGYPSARRAILAAAHEAAAIITVSDGLRQALIALGAPAARITTLRNGVDLAAFRPLDRDAARSRFRVTGPTLVSVGALIPRKGHEQTIEAMRLLEGWTLLIAGEGPERARLEALARRLGVAERVRLLGPLPHDQLPALYSAADISVLASSREGWANVLLESMACGTPAVASPIPGNDEVVRAPPAGRITAARSAEAIAEAVLAVVAQGPRREATRAYAERFSWDETSAGQLRIFRQSTGRT